MRMNVTAEEIDLEVLVPMIGRRRPTWVTVAARAAEPRLDYAAILNPGETAIAYQLEG